MCHPWLAAGVSAFIGALAMREFVPLLSDRGGRWAPDAGLLGGALRTWFRSRIEPLVDVLADLGATANAVTAVQLALSVLCGVAYGAGYLFTAGWLLLTAGTLDVLDGALARRRGVAGARGAFVDSVVDRYGESAVLFGLAVQFQHGWPLWAVLAAFVGGFMVSYARARAEGVGVVCGVGLMQRPERYVVLGAGSMLGALAAHLACDPMLGRAIVIASLLAIAVLANVTALQRALFVVRRLS